MLLSCGDLPNTEAAVLSVAYEISGEELPLELPDVFLGECELEDDEGEGFSLSATYDTCPSKILVIVRSTLLVFT